MSLSQVAREIPASPTLAMNERARLLREKGEPVIHLGAGEPKNRAPVTAILGAAGKLKEAEVKYTPAEGTVALRQAIIRYTEECYGRLVAPENVIVSNGAKQALWNLLYAILDPQDEVVVLGKLTAGNVIKTAFGGSSITRSRENGEPIAISDDLKAAASDSLKKACSLLGIGLHLYSDDRPQQPLRPRNGGQVRTVRLGGSGGNGEGTNGPNRLSAKAGNGGNGGDRLSQKQLHAVWACAKDKAIPEQHVRSHSLEKYGKQVEFLAKAEASELISTIQSC